MTPETAPAEQAEVDLRDPAPSAVYVLDFPAWPLHMQALGGAAPPLTTVGWPSLIASEVAALFPGVEAERLYRVMGNNDGELPDVSYDDERGNCAQVWIDLVACCEHGAQYLDSPKFESLSGELVLYSAAGRFSPTSFNSMFCRRTKDGWQKNMWVLYEPSAAKADKAPRPVPDPLSYLVCDAVLLGMTGKLEEGRDGLTVAEELVERHAAARTSAPPPLQKVGRSKLFVPGMAGRWWSGYSVAELEVIGKAGAAVPEAREAARVLRRVYADLAANTGWGVYAAAADSAAGGDAGGSGPSAGGACPSAAAGAVGSPAAAPPRFGAAGASLLLSPGSSEGRVPRAAAVLAQVSGLKLPSCTQLLSACSAYH